MADNVLLVKEIYPAIFGESSWAGWPGVIVRLSGCNLRCSYCDTAYAYDGGREHTIFSLLPKIKRYRLDRALITGGEPLLQPAAVPLMDRLVAAGFSVMLETNGTQDFSTVPASVHVVMDIKGPGSGHSDSINLDIFKALKPSDEVKVVMTDRKDYLWARDMVKHPALAPPSRIIFSPAFGMLDPGELARWMIKDRLPVRLGLQLHKYMFGPDQRRT